jgi:hypothetical protein
VRGNRTGRGWFKKGQSGNPSGLPKTPPVLLEFAPHTDDPFGADRRTVGNLVVEARKFSGLAVDTLVELTKNTHTDSTRSPMASRCICADTGLQQKIRLGALVLGLTRAASVKAEGDE